VLLLHDNATAHTASVATSVAAECGYELLPHTPYSQYLAPSDFYFPLSKQHLRGRQYASDNDIIQSVKDFLEVQDELFYQTGIQKLQKRWNKCIEVQGDYCFCIMFTYYIRSETFGTTLVQCRNPTTTPNFGRIVQGACRYCIASEVMHSDF